MKIMNFNLFKRNKINCGGFPSVGCWIIAGNTSNRNRRNPHFFLNKTINDLEKWQNTRSNRLEIIQENNIGQIIYKYHNVSAYQVSYRVKYDDNLFKNDIENGKYYNPSEIYNDEILYWSKDKNELQKFLDYLKEKDLSKKEEELMIKNAEKYGL